MCRGCAGDGGLEQPGITDFLVDCPTPNVYLFELIVNDGIVASEPVFVRVRTVNSPPVANAGLDRHAATGETVRLDGSGSSDLDGDAITYLWTFVSRPVGSTAALSDARTAFPHFMVDVPGTYRIRLSVSDPVSSSATDTVIVSTVNTPPVANAGRDQHLPDSQNVQLDGSRSNDADEQLLQYSWSLVGRPPDSFSRPNDASLAKPFFFADVPGTYIAQLVVRDGLLSSAPDTVRITIGDIVPPVADAGLDQFTSPGVGVRLTAAGSTDSNGRELGFRWALVSRPPGSTSILFNVAAVRPTLVPDRPGEYIAQLVASDGLAISEPDSVIITATAVPGNIPPIADAGADQTTPVGIATVLDGTRSRDANGDPLTYHWTIAARPQGSTTQIQRDLPVTTLVPDIDGTYVVNLQVSDGFVTSTRDTVVVSTFNSDPVAFAQTASGQEEVAIGNPVPLDGSLSNDVDFDTLSFQWSLLVRPSSSFAEISDSTTATPAFVADVGGTYIVQLIVTSFNPFTSAFVQSQPVTVLVAAVPHVNAPPIADAGADQTVALGQLVQLDAVGSTDPDHDQLRYSWTLKAPPGSGAALNDRASKTPTFTADVDGVYTATLVVRDAQISSAPDVVVVTTAGIAVDPLTIDFGEQEVATTSDPRIITITSTGTGALSVFDVMVTSSAYQVIDNTCTTAAIPKSGVCTVRVVFTPGAGGSFPAELLITSNGAVTPQVVMLAGSGVRRVLTIDPTTLDFGAQDAGVPGAAQLVTVTSSGGGSVTLGTLTVTGDFTIANDSCSGVLLAASTSCTFEVVFTPAAEGARSGSVTIPSNAAASPHLVTLSGNGIVRALTISPLAIDFANVNRRSAVVDRLTRGTFVDRKH